MKLNEQYLSQGSWERLEWLVNLKIKFCTRRIKESRSFTGHALHPCTPVKQHCQRNWAVANRQNKWVTAQMTGMSAWNCQKKRKQLQLTNTALVLSVCTCNSSASRNKEWRGKWFMAKLQSELHVEAGISEWLSESGVYHFCSVDRLNTMKWNSSHGCGGVFMHWHHSSVAVYGSCVAR